MLPEKCHGMIDAVEKIMFSSDPCRIIVLV